MAKNKGGRPTVMTPETIKAIEYAFSIGCSDTEACFYAGIGTTTLYTYQENNPEFAERKALLKESPTFEARRTVVNAVSSDPDMALKYLERKRKSEFSTRSESIVEQTDVKGFLDNLDE